MKVILFGALCVAASFALASSSTHRCCDLHKTSLLSSTSSECNEAKCQSAFSDLTQHSPSIEFYAGCRDDVPTPFPLIENLANCGQGAVNRSYTLSDERTGSPAVQNAIFTLAYGCISKAKSPHCSQSLRAFLRPASGLLGFSAKDVSLTAFTNLQVSLVSVLRQCNQPVSGSFAGSEWDSGMASCYHVGEDNNQASLSGYVGRPIAPGGTGECPACTIGSASSVVPFCADFFSSQGTTRLGAHCGTRSLVQDRVAQAFHTMWFRTGTAKIHQTAVNITTGSKRCRNYLRQLACQTTLGQCSEDGQSINNVCASVCENELTAGCGLSSMAAQQACESLGATRAVTASCPAATATAELMKATENVTKQAAAAEDSKVVLDPSGAQHPYINVTLCIAPLITPTTSAGFIRVQINGFLADLCRNCTDINGTIIMGGEECAHEFTALMGPTTMTDADVTASFAAKLPTATVMNKLTVSTTMVPVNQLQSSTVVPTSSTITTSGASVIEGSWMLLMSAVLAVLF